MLQLTETLQDLGFDNHVFKEHELARVLKGSDASRYALVNKALRKGELIRISRGVYVLAEKYRKVKLSKFYIASRLQPASYVTCESALSYHGWIPERVALTISAYNKERQLSYETPFGEFNYNYVATRQFEFFTSVKRATLDEKPFLIAAPLRAITDLIYIRKLDDVDLEYLTESMRIEDEFIYTINPEEIDQLLNTYRSRRVCKFLKKLRKELRHEL